MPCHSYLFFDTEPSMRELSGSALADAKRAFVAAVAAAEAADETRRVHVEAYGTLALKAGSRFMLHMNAASPDAIQALARDLLHTAFGAHLCLSYTLLGNTRSSQYNPKHAPPASAPEVPHRYLTVYPFVKTIEWHLLPFEQRRSIMKDHVDVGRKFSSKISQLLLYAFGIDDHEFIVSYQMDSLEEFQTLVMELRGTEARRYTVSDTPIFTCIHMPLADAIDMA